MGDYRCELALLIDNNATDNFAHRVAIVESHLAQQVKVVTSGKEAIAFLKKAKDKLPQLILFDVHIPVLEGQVFLHEYAGLTHFDKDDVKIVILTYKDKAAYLERLLINNEISKIEIKPLTLESCERLGELV
ncbi:hypothetical protein N6H18_12950 [Reichenbachiella agarivorans]|uniref:Response regulatory domain-containing protein n=1 Tax=Reichenbachiella agarivorans TaxID=2979464 RepID=A0ABY6CL98_9BACT|nr:hypothetical protein [Reichenbachiella agarivorans]UXP31257.1 hypothetical protein N6H18_12950 [Reichenbachiella agarivorans]